MSRFFRQESPPQFDDYRRYRPFLQRDFHRLCAYCERPEAAIGGEEFFEIDHLRPKSRFPEQLTHYSNVYYACGKCNRHKSETWPSESLLAQGFRFSDPCEEDMYVDHLEERQDGTLLARTKCGDYTKSHIRLDRLDLRVWRQTKRQIAEELPILRALAGKLQDIFAIESDPFVRDDIQLKLIALERVIHRQRQLYSL
jgi:hypothetical protein